MYSGISGNKRDKGKTSSYKLNLSPHKMLLIKIFAIVFFKNLFKKVHGDLPMTLLFIVFTLRGTIDQTLMK